MTTLQVGDPIKVTVKKYDPSQDSAPYYKTYTVPYTREMRILEALDYIVEELGESLAYQWFCGVKKCGMCGFFVNGRPQLGCWEPVQPEMVIEPLPHFPVIRDLVIDRGQYVENLLALQPWIQREEPYAGFPEPMTGVQMEDAAEMMHCIECMMCVSACPTYSSEFVGPAPSVQLARFALDPRDSGPRAQLAKEVGGIEHCVSCYQCSAACPTGIPVLQIAIGGLRQQIRDQNLEKPITLRGRAFAHIHTLSKLGSALAPLSNWLGRLKPVRWLTEKFLGIDQRRQWPTFASVPFDRWFKSRKAPARGGQQVILFHDTFMTYIEPEIGIATTELLEAAGYEVLLIDGRKCCGRPMLSQGLEDEARANAEHNVGLLAPYAKRGIPIIGCEPGCLLTIREEYPTLVPGEDAQVVASQTYTLEEFLAERAVTNGGEPALSFTDEARELVLHGHCHQKALVGTGPALKVLSLPASYEVAEIPSGCCGMAGSNGFECEHYERSLQAAEETLLPAVREAGADVEIVAAGISCRQQIAHGTGRTARHPALVLRDALLTKDQGRR
ncbi:MAG: 2Fe-2S iron-sulfur cluster-binding protein [Anaerolineae bacterium]